MKRALVVAMVISACATYRFQRVEGELPSIHPSMFTDVHCAGLEVRQYAKPKCARAMKPRVTCPAQSPLKSELSFVLFGAARQREHRVVLTNGDELPAIDDPSFVLSRNDDATLLSLVLAANQLDATCPTIAAPRFVLHTGDAVSTGLFSELTQFVAAMDQSNVPWLTAIGPNDVRFLGELPNESVSSLNVTAPYLPIADGDHFMGFMSEPLGARFDPSIPSFGASRPDHGPSFNGCRRTSGTSCNRDASFMPGTGFHGFDFACERQGTRLCTQARGYYAFDVPSTRFKVVVLNTSELTVDDGAHGTRVGRMMEEQHRWLKRQLRALSADQYALVIGHHALDDFEDERLSQTLTAAPRVLGYFHGSDVPNVSSVGNLKTFGVAPVLDAPQLAQAIEVLSDDGGKLFIRSTSFERTFVGPGDEPEIEPRPLGATDVCAQPVSSCSMLYKRAQFAHDAAWKLGIESEVPGFADRARTGANTLVQVFTPEGKQ